ncbi:hypothetical protein C8Q76DRAFT_629087 [Earliella scabrosa]|nr:hypothetical protein C8Q76DRAFT_629087 [Earliella scabrosa]
MSRRRTRLYATDASSQPETYGRNRQSIADLEQELYDIFQDHPQCQFNDSNEPVIPGDALVDVLRTFSQGHNALELMTRDEEEQLTSLIASNPGLQVTPQVLIQFIAMQTTVSPHHSPDDSPPQSTTAADFDERGRSEDRDYDGMNSRSSSRDSTATYYRSSSRGPPPPPKTPFDSGRRQRTTPLNNNTAPSSWSRRPPPSRRKSDAGHSRALSDSESVSSSPTAYNRTPGRSRAPSNPTSPTFTSPPLAKSISSPPFGGPSRPHSRAQSQPQSHFASFDSAANDYYGSSPERELDHRQTGLMSPPPSDNSFDDEQPFHEQISSLPMPRKGSDSDSDDDDMVADHLLGLVMDRSAASSTVSLDMQERLDALQRLNTDLGRKLLEAERTLQNRLAEHEQELEDMQSRLEEARSELSATKREEKELRSKERTNSTQIAALESEIAKLQKSLDTARASYQSLQKQYQEQCAESERYRNNLRRRDQEIKDFQDAANLHAVEAQKWLREQATYEERILVLEGELNVAQQAQAQLDEQKQENMMLKETIDRMRFDMDELRNSAHSLDKGGGSGTASAHGSVSKSLGAELLSKMKDGKWDMEEEEEEEEPHSVEIEVTPEDDETESEDYVQTIITRTKRKVASRAKKIETFKIDEVKEYSDTGTQHEPEEFTSTSAVQTDPPPKILTTSFSVQTEEPPVSTTSTQTDPEPTPIPVVVITVEREIQTDEWQPEASTSGQTSEEDDDALASSSSTLLPPTPKAQPEHLHTHDLPPAYDKVTGEDMALRVANETLKTWHPGLKLPIQPLVGGISEDAIEDWKALKEELGVECTAIDKIVEETTRNNQARPSRDGKSSRRKSGRFYNIYNTYVYGDPDGGSIINGQLLICVGASALVAFLMGQAMAPQYSIPGGVTYYDRAAWSSFNSMQAAGEGFTGDTTAVWSFLGRLGGGAARTLRGWPT